MNVYELTPNMKMIETKKSVGRESDTGLENSIKLIIVNTLLILMGEEKEVRIHACR